MLPTPDVTVFLDIAPEDGGDAQGSRTATVYERDLALLARVRESYRRQAARDGWVVIDADADER